MVDCADLFVVCVDCGGFDLVWLLLVVGVWFGGCGAVVRFSYGLRCCGFVQYGSVVFCGWFDFGWVCISGLVHWCWLFVPCGLWDGFGLLGGFWGCGWF